MKMIQLLLLKLNMVIMIDWLQELLKLLVQILLIIFSDVDGLYDKGNKKK